MRACGLSSCLIFSMIQLIYCREYARPSPTDMPYSQRDALNKKEDMKNYFKALKSFRVARPDTFNNESGGLGNLVVEGEKIRIPCSARGLSEVTKIYLDQNRLSRYLRILDMELERTPSTIELDSSKIANYVKMLNNVDKHDGKSADLVSRSRIKLMKTGMSDNINYNDKGHEKGANFNYPPNKREIEGNGNVDVKSMDAKDGNNGILFYTNADSKKPEEKMNEDQGSQNPFEYPSPVSDMAGDQYIETENDDLDPDFGNQLLDHNIQLSDVENNVLSENMAPNKFSVKELSNVEPLNKEMIENMKIQIMPLGATGIEKRLENDQQESVENNFEPYLPNIYKIGGSNEKSALNDRYENYKIKNPSVFDSPFNVPVPINHLISKDFGATEDKRINNNVKRKVEFQYPKMDQPMTVGGNNYDNTNRLQQNGPANERYITNDSVKNIDRENLGSILNNLQNKLYQERPMKKLSLASETSDVLIANNSSFNKPVLHNVDNDVDHRNVVDIKTAAFFSNSTSYNPSSTYCPFNSEIVSNGPLDHRIFPLKPEDEIVNIPNMKYFEQCFNGENNHCQISEGMPTKPPSMFSKFYHSKLKNFEKYDDDPGSLKFLRQPRFPSFGTKENEVSKILNVNLEHLHMDKDALFKIIGKALKVDEEPKENFVPPKWLEQKYEEFLHASHRGQNINDYDYIEKSLNNFNHDHFNFRDRKETSYEKIA